MNLIKCFYPTTTRFPDTPFNKNVSLVESLGEPTLVSDDLIESGHLLTSIWNHGIKKLLPKHFVPNSVLILGLGGGSNTILVSKLYPSAKITAIEIDQQMVDIANNYFHLNKVKNLKIIVGDAKKAVLESAPNSYDLVLVDCFVGKYIPENLQEMSFISSLYTISTYTLINRVWYNEHHLETVFFLKKISQYFPYSIVHTRTNSVVSLL